MYTQATHTSPDPISISLNNEIVFIPAVISSEVALEYNEFFSKLYTGYSKKEESLREIESLSGVNSAGDIQGYLTKMNISNGLSYIWSRVHRIGTQVLAAGAVILAYSYY